MDLYNIWCNLKPGTSDVEFSASVERYLEELQRTGRIAAFRIMRRKLGLGPRGLGEFHILIEVEDLTQLDRAFQAASARSDPIEGLHAAVNRSVCDLTFALYRDFPDAHRERGNEQF